MESYIKFVITCGDGKKGIHIRNAIENKIIEHPVTVEPFFLNNEDVGKLFSYINNCKLNTL